MATIKDHGSWKDMSWQKVIAKNRKLSTLWNQSQRSLVLGILNGWKKKDELATFGWNCTTIQMMKKNCIKKMVNQIGWVAKVFKKTWVRFYFSSQ
jgi:hypothetical protein